MEQRVTRPEERMAGARNDLHDIKQALQVLPTLPTKRDLQSFALTGIGLALAVIVIIIGGSSWLETRQARIGPASISAVAPIVIRVPAQAPAPPPHG